jgi:hypothetical protein
MSYSNIEKQPSSVEVILVNKNTKPNQKIEKNDKHPAGKLKGSRRVWSGRWPVVKTLPIEQELQQVYLGSQLVAKFTLFFENSDSLGKPRYGLARERDGRTLLDE